MAEYAYSMGFFYGIYAIAHSDLGIYGTVGSSASNMVMVFGILMDFDGIIIGIHHCRLFSELRKVP